MVEVDELNGFAGGHRAKGDHQHGADNRHRRAINLRAGKLPIAKTTYEGQKDEKGGEAGQVGQGKWLKADGSRGGWHARDEVVNEA